MIPSIPSNKDLDGYRQEVTGQLFRTVKGAIEQAHLDGVPDDVIHSALILALIEVLGMKATQQAIKRSVER